MTFLVVSVQRERIGSRAAKHRLDEPARLSLSMVASLQSLPPFHPAVHFSSAVLNFQFARLAGGTIPFILAGGHTQPRDEPSDADLGLLRPASDEIHY